MNIRKIIREELNNLSDTFYLLVSKGESFVWSQNRLAGWSFEPIEELDIEDILRSSFRSFNDAEDILNKFSKYRKENLLKYEPKVITVDFILNKRDQNFPIFSVISSAAPVYPSSNPLKVPPSFEASPNLPINLESCLINGIKNFTKGKNKSIDITENKLTKGPINKFNPSKRAPINAAIPNIFKALLSIFLSVPVLSL